MKLRSVKIRNFKGIRELDLDLCSPHTGEPRPLTCILGDNGSGKTTVLQAIALPLALATRRIRGVEEFAWPGFLPERVGSLGKTSVELEVELSADALKMTFDAMKVWQKLSEHRDAIHALASPEYTNTEQPTTALRLRLEGSELAVANEGYSIEDLAGRRFIQDLSRTDPAWAARIPEVGSVFWFDQYRTLETAARAIPELRGQPTPAQVRPSVQALRELLVGWWAYHGGAEKGDSSDLIAELEGRFAQLFPGARFAGVKPRSGVDRVRGAGDFYFRVQRDAREYDIEEMASGEQVVFSLFLEFVLQRIYRSIVLIDEVELHLHPPEQQALLRALQRSDFGNQYIITTHSPYLEQVIPDEHEIRLERGNLCL